MGARGSLSADELGKLVLAAALLVMLVASLAAFAWAVPTVAAWTTTGETPGLGLVEAATALGDSRLLSAEPGGAYPRDARPLIPPAGEFWLAAALTAIALAASLADGPTFAHGMTKTMLNQEWSMTVEQAIEAEAQAQAICMQTRDFERAYKAFAAKTRPVFEGN